MTELMGMDFDDELISRLEGEIEGVSHALRQERIAKGLADLQGACGAGLGGNGCKRR